jgi:hypothetical protein
MLVNKFYEEASIAILSIFAVVVGLIAGQAIFDFTKLSIWIGHLVTLLTFFLGPRILYISWKDKELVLLVTVLIIWVANVLFSLNIDASPAVDILFSISTFMALVVMFKYSNICHERRNSSRPTCEYCPHSENRKV